MIGEVTDTGHMVLEFERRGRVRHPARPARRRSAAATSGPTRSRKRREPLTDIPESTDIAADLLKLMASPNLASRRWVWEQYDQSGRRRHGPAPGRRRCGGARARLEEGAGDHHRLHAALLLRRPGRRREAGGRRGLSQPLRGRRQAARDHQLPQFRQPAAARDHGPVRRLRRRHGRSLPRARLPGRERQRRASTTRPRTRTASSLAILPTPAIGGVGLLDDWQKSRRRSAFKAEGEASRSDRPHERAMSANRCGSRSATAGAKARRRRSISPSSGGPANSSASSLPTASSPPSMTVPMAAPLVAIAEMALAGNHRYAHDGRARDR